jgi:hypothetical protein
VPTEKPSDYGFRWVCRFRPGTQEVTVSEQLGAKAAVDPDPTQEQAVEHQQPDPMLKSGLSLDSPPAPGQPDRPGHALGDRLIAVLGADGLGQVGVLVPDLTQAFARLEQ